jgi:predicted NAD-dependent protein-ADP-ribosyltransferase YbiA (DUF1768 family)
MSKNDILYLYDTEQVPFGKLSPLYRTKLDVLGVETSNVISYCYAGLLKKGGIRNYILNESGKDAMDQSMRYFREEKDNIYNNSLHDALLERVRQDPVAKKQLIDSGNSIIIYQSSNLYLGVNEKSQGQNKVGNILMNIRNSFIKDDIEKQKILREKEIENLKYNISIVYNTLEDRITRGIDDLSSYIGKNANEIIEMLNLPRFKGEFKGDLDDHISEYILKSDKIAEDLRKIHAEEYNESVLKISKKDLLYDYLINQAIKSFPPDYDDLYNRWKEIKKNRYDMEEYKNMYEKIKPITGDINNLIKDLDEKGALIELEDRIYFLYEKGFLPNLSIDNIVFLPIEKINETDYKKYLDSNRALIEELKKFKEDKDKLAQKQKDEYKESIKQKIRKWKENQRYLAKLENYYLSKALQEYEEYEQDEQDEQDEENIRKLNSFQKIHEYYQDKYPEIYEKLSQTSRRIKDEITLQNLLKEYSEMIPKTPVYWKDGVLVKQNVDIQDIDIQDKIFSKYFAKITRKSAFSLFVKEKYPEIEKKNPSMKRSEIISKLNQLWNSEMTDRQKKKYKDKEEKVKAEIPEYIQKILKEENKEPPMQQTQQQSFFRFDDTSPLSPSYISMITIQKLIFPNPFYYIYFKLVLSVIETILKEHGEKLNPVSVSHNLLLFSPDLPSRNLENFRPFNQISELYTNLENQFIEITLKNRAVKVLEEKFNLTKNPKLAKLLIASNPKTLVYNDKIDLYLGSGPILKDSYQGKNIIGKIMTNIRKNLSEEYGTEVIIEEIRDFTEEEEQREIVQREKKDVELTDFSYDKMKEYLYIFMVYVTYIKESKSIELQDVKFVMEVLYHNLYNKAFENLKIPKITYKFKDEAESFLSKYNYSISTEGLNKLWNYIYIINKLMKVDLEDKNLDPFGLTKIESLSEPISYENISQYISNIEYEIKDWIISSIKNSLTNNDKICVSIGLTYRKDDRDEKATNIMKTNCKFIDKDYNDKTIEVLYLSLTKELLNKIKDNVYYKESVIDIYTPTISILRKNYVSERIKDCTKYTDNQVHNCILESYIDIIGNLRKQNITEITPNVLNFATSLLSVSGNLNSFTNPYLIQNIKNQKFVVMFHTNLKEQFKENQENSKFKNIISSALNNMPFVEKSMGKYTFNSVSTYGVNKDSKEEYQYIDLYVPVISIENNNEFQIALNINIITTDDTQYNKKYTIKGSDSEIISVEETGEESPKITFNVKGTRLYLTLDNRMIESINIVYKMVLKVKNINILSKIISLSSSIDKFARVLSFLPSRQNLFKDIEEELEEEELKRQRNKYKKRKVEEEDEGDEERDEEEDEEEDEGEEGYEGGSYSNDEEEEGDQGDEGDDEEYYDNE